MKEAKAKKTKVVQRINGECAHEHLKARVISLVDFMGI